MSEILPVLSEPIPALGGGQVPDTAAGDFGAARLAGGWVQTPNPTS